MALKSGLNSSIAWSLNALTILSFNSQHPLLMAKHPGILQAMVEVNRPQPGRAEFFTLPVLMQNAMTGSPNIHWCLVEYATHLCNGLSDLSLLDST